jgi:hypothetical protein
MTSNSFGHGFNDFVPITHKDTRQCIERGTYNQFYKIPGGHNIQKFPPGS